MNYVRISILIFIVSSCHEPPNKLKETNMNKVKKLSLLLCGYSRTFNENENENPKDSIALNGLLFEAYLIELDSNGKMSTTVGLGEFTSNGPNSKDDLQMNYIKSSDTIFISNRDLQSILNQSNEILKKKEYWSNLYLTDSWFVKLKINNKTNVFYYGEGALSPIDNIGPEYMQLTTEIVKLSPIQIKDFR
jgi:hypothetical protein